MNIDHNYFEIPEGFYPIKNFEDCYAISKNGEVMRIKKNYGATVGKILKNQINKKRGYLIITLSNKGITKTYDIHILMANTFLNRVDNSLQVCHNNGIKTDCRLENLRLDTRSENEKDKILHCVCNRGERSGHNKYSQNLILQIRKELESNIKPKIVSEKYNIPYSYIIHIKNKTKWAWL